MRNIRNYFTARLIIVFSFFPQLPSVAGDVDNLLAPTHPKCISIVLDASGSVKHQRRLQFLRHIREGVLKNLLTGDLCLIYLSNGPLMVKKVIKDQSDNDLIYQMIHVVYQHVKEDGDLLPALESIAKTDAQRRYPTRIILIYSDGKVSHPSRVLDIIRRFTQTGSRVWFTGLSHESDGKLVDAALTNKLGHVSVDDFDFLDSVVVGYPQSSQLSFDEVVALYTTVIRSIDVIREATLKTRALREAKELEKKLREANDSMSKLHALKDIFEKISMSVTIHDCRMSSEEALNVLTHYELKLRILDRMLVGRR